MTQVSTLKQNGQITIPNEILERMGIKEGDQLEIVFENGQITILPGVKHVSPFEKYIGALPFNGDPIEWVRDMRDDE